MPMLPARRARRPASRRILWTRVVVVDLPLEPVIGDDPALEEQAGQLDLREDRDAPVAGGQDLGDGRDARAGDDEVGREERLRPVAARLEDDAAVEERAELGSEGLGRLLVADGDPGAAVEEKTAESFAGPLEADDEDAPAAKFHVYLNFRVDRLKRAKMMPRIQNRMTTRPSGQPESSKWWWSGAILKTRLPPLSLK